MESNNNLEEKEAVLTQQFKNDLESFFIAYPAEDFRMCLQNIYAGFLGSELCTLGFPLVRQQDGIMFMEFMGIISNQDY